jgi:hypothetical protein
VPLCANNQLAVHDITWQIGKVAAGGGIRKNQSGLLNPTSARIQSGAAFGLVKVSWQEMHRHHTIPLANLGNFGIVQFNQSVHSVARPNEKGERCGGDHPKMWAAKSPVDKPELLAEASGSAAFAPPTGSAIDNSSTQSSPVMPSRPQGNRETRERHDKKSTPSVEPTRESTEGNETKRQAVPSFPWFPSVQKVRALAPNVQLRHSRRSGMWPATMMLEFSINGQLHGSAAVAWSVWFGNPTFIDSKISGQLRRTRRDGRASHRAPNSNPLRSSPASAASALKNQTQRRRERRESLRMNNAKNTPG